MPTDRQTDPADTARAAQFVEFDLIRAEWESLDAGWSLYHAVVAHICKDAAYLDTTADVGFFDSLLALAEKQRTKATTAGDG